MLGIKQIKTDGTVIDLGRQRLTLADAQELVSTGIMPALIEQVAIQGMLSEVGDHAMFVNEEGLILDLPYNFKASEISGVYITGDAIIVENEASDFE